HFQSAACQGFRWYEVDITYYALRALAAVGLVKSLQRPPRDVVRSEKRLRRAVVEKAAGQLARSFHVEQIAAELCEQLSETRANPSASSAEFRDGLVARLGEWSDQLDGRLAAARHDLDGLLSTVHPPAVPTMAELRGRAAAMFAGTPSMND